jgi:hypothetical protein
MCDRADEDTIELQLSAEELEALTRAAAEPEPSPPESVTSFDGQVRAFAFPVIVIVAFAGLLNGVKYTATAQEQKTSVVAPAPRSATRTPQMSPPASTAPEPVRYTNPFDASEVFEFPPGTTEVEARDAVADLLLQRARDRVRRPAQQIRVAHPGSAQLTARTDHGPRDR